MPRESITVLGREIVYEIKDVDIFTLRFYEKNPRIHYYVTNYPRENITQEFIQEQILRLDSTKELIKSLEENKGLLDEIYVVGNEVVEGNTRLAAYRRLYEKHKDEIWHTIKARILPSDITEEELFYILGTFHIKGKKEWDAYEKASYIYRTIKQFKKSPEEIAGQLGHQAKTIKAKMSAYEIMRDRYLPETSGRSINGTRDELRKYSYFEAFFVQKDLVKRFEETPAFMDEFIDMVKTERLPKAEAVRDLPKILENKKACRAFLEEEPESAYKAALATLYVHKPEKVDKFYKKVREFRDLMEESNVQKISLEVKEASTGGKSKKDELMRCYKSFKRFCKEIGLDVR